MDLKDFISDSVIQIIQGVTAAQDYVKDNAPTAKVAPVLDDASGPRDGFRARLGGNPVQLVDFDVAVETGSRDEAQGGVGVLMAVFTVGVRGKEETTISEYSRLKFSIPVELPHVHS
jgi:hypothetical protein